MRSLTWILTTACLSLTGCMQNEAGDDWKISKGDRIPEFSLQTSDGQKFSKNDLIGKPAYLAVFATWCPPCKQELKALEAEVWPDLKKQGGQIVAVSTGEDIETVRDFVERERLTFPVLVDEHNEFVSKLGGSFVPRGVVLTKEGTVDNFHSGFSSEILQSIKTELEDLL